MKIVSMVFVMCLAVPIMAAEVGGKNNSRNRLFEAAVALYQHSTSTDYYLFKLVKKALQGKKDEVPGDVQHKMQKLDSDIARCCDQLFDALADEGDLAMESFSIDWSPNKEFTKTLITIKPKLKYQGKVKPNITCIYQAMNGDKPVDHGCSIFVPYQGCPHVPTSLAKSTTQKMDTSS